MEKYFTWKTPEKFCELAPANDENLVTTFGADVPGCYRAGDTDYDGPKQCGPETRYLKIIEHRGNEAEHRRVQDKDKQAHRDYRERQRKEKHQWSNEGVDEAEEKRCEYETTDTFDPHTRYEPRRQEQSQHGYHSAYKDALHAAIMTLVATQSADQFATIPALWHITPRP